MWVCDLAVADEVDRLAASATSELGRVDVLVNNAGVPKRRDISHLDPETDDALAAYDASKAALSVFSEAMAVDLWDTGVKVLTVYPGVVDTELFDIPGNDPLPPELGRIPVGDVVDAVIDALCRDALEVYVPEWFKDIAARKASDVEKFLAGTASWARERNASGGADGQA